MSFNPFASYNIEIPVCYRESVLKFCRSGGNKSTTDFAPFDRQVDFWFIAFVIAINKKLKPEKHSDTYKATDASILTTDAERVGFLQISALGYSGEIEILKDTRKLFEICLELANAGMPHLIQILENPDDRPLWALMDELESLAN